MSSKQKQPPSAYSEAIYTTVTPIVGGIGMYEGRKIFRPAIFLVTVKPDDEVINHRLKGKSNKRTLK